MTFQSFRERSWAKAKEQFEKGVAGMKRFIAALGVLAALGACGDGTPFADSGTGTDGGDTDTDSSIPEEIAGDLDGFTFNPTTGELTITGVFLDDEPATTGYTRTASLDVPGYIAYTAQEDPLDSHVTAYVQAISDVTGAIAVSGGQFARYNGGVNYSRSGDFDRPDVSSTTGLTTYAGNYVGIINSGTTAGPDLLPVPGGTDPSILPSQAARIEGLIFINVDFVDNTLKGVVYDRQIFSPDGTPLTPDFATGAGEVPDLILIETDVTDDGTFAGQTEIVLSSGRNTVGEYGGIFGGTDSEGVAGGIRATEHFDNGSSGEEEYGLFVLGRCGSASETSALCSTVPVGE